MTPTVNGITITDETIQATREWFAVNAVECIMAAGRGEYHVNDLAKYSAWQEARMTKFLRGDYDHTLTFVQRALFIQTGSSPALLA